MALKHIDVNGISWPYLEAGNPEADTLVLLHGFGANKDNWPIYADLLKNDFHIICPDLPGFGENTDNPDLDYHTAIQADRVQDFLNELNIHQCHLSGNSMGGLITLHYALRHPEELLSITLFNNAGVSSEHKSQLEIGMDRGENLLAISSLSDVDKVIAFATYKPPKLPTPIKKMFYQKFKEREVLHNQIYTGLIAENKTPLDDQLHNIKTPTLIIWGRNDQLLDVTCTNVLQRELPDNHCVILEKTGHTPMIERPNKTANIQRKFLKKY